MSERINKLGAKHWRYLGSTFLNRRLHLLELRPGMSKLFSARAPVTNLSFKGPQYVAKAVSKLDCHTLKMIA